MKTIKITTLLVLSLIMTMGIFANTTTFIMAEEAYINDIPFDTGEIKVNCLYNRAMAENFEMEEESYIDDIPFNTVSIAVNKLSLNAMSTEFDLPEENYIDDIPFSTKRVANNLICKK